ncbi:MAG: DUF1284 domain-containing protein [Devosia sp.]|uniref:DUF1284 domain-containing protein n=1 Tax=Devosia sp. TaxID=1871048 RepID=UPI00339A7BC8
MTVRLRPHHLLCLLTYVGKGYSADFTKNFDAIAERLSAGENILIVEGPDDICAPLLAGDSAHCLRDSVRERDRHAADDMAHLFNLTVAPDAIIEIGAETLAAWRAAFRSTKTRSACAGCDWNDLCTAIANADFAGASITR